MQLGCSSVGGAWPPPWEEERRGVWPTGQEAEWEGSPPCALLRLGTWGPRPCGLWTLWLYPQQGVSAYHPAPIQDTPTRRGLAAHAECRGPRWPRRSRPRGPAPSTWPASAAAPGPARPGAGRPCAVRGTRHAAAAPPPAPGWRAAGGPSLHGTAARARHTLPPTRCPPPPCVTRAGQVRASGFVLRSTGRPRRSCQVWTARPGKSPPGRVPLQAGWPSLHQPRVSPSFRRSSGSCGSDAAGGPRKTCWKAGSSGSAAAVGEGREPWPGPPQARGPRGRALTGAAAEGHGHVVVGQGAEGLGLDVHQRGPGEGHVFADGRLGHGPVHQLVLGRHLPAHVAVGPSGDCRVSPARPHPAPWPHVPGRAPRRACAPSSRCLCCPEAGTEGSEP